MPSRFVNSFNLLAVILLAIGIAGACSGGKLVFDPGRAATGKEWIIYVVAGALMLVNGFLPAANPADTKPGDTAATTRVPKTTTDGSPTAGDSSSNA